MLMESAGNGVMKRSSLAAFSAASASLIFFCSSKTPALCMFCAASSLASTACFFLIYFRGIGVCLSIVVIFLCPWMVVSAHALCCSEAGVPGWVDAALLLFLVVPLHIM